MIFEGLRADALLVMKTLSATPRKKHGRTNKINEDGGPINPAEGISLFAGMEGKEGMGMNSLSLPRRWQLMLRCRAEGEAAKGLITCQNPPSPLKPIHSQ
jgi:hypothetical protein